MKRAKAKAPSEVNLLDALEAMEDQIPLTPEERAQHLPSPEAMAAGLKRLMDTVEAAQAQRAQQALEPGRAGREAAVRKLKASVVHRSRAENLKLIATYRSQRPEMAQRVAFYRNLDDVPDEDLDLLVADLQALAEAK